MIIKILLIVVLGGLLLGAFAWQDKIKNSRFLHSVELQRRRRELQEAIRREEVKL